MGKIGKISAWNLTKVRSKKEVIDKARTKGAQVQFASLMDICHLKNAELEAKHQKYKGRVVLRGDIVKYDSGSYAVFTEQGSSASTNDNSKSHGYHFQIAWLRRTSSWRSISFFPYRNGGCSKCYSKIHQIGMSRHLDSSTATEMALVMVQYRRPSRSSWTKSVRSSFDRVVMGKEVWENPFEVRLGKGFQLGMLILAQWKRVILIYVCGWHQIGSKKTKHWSDVESTQQRSWFGRTNIFPWSWKTWDALNDNAT